MTKKNNIKPYHFLIFLLFTISLTVFSFLSVYNPLTIGLVACVFLPTYVLFSAQPERFEKVKIITLIVSKTLFVLTVLTIIPTGIFTFLVIWSLRLNILEAIYQDFAIKKYLNMFSGLIILIATFGLNCFWVEGQNYYLFNASYLYLWIIGYTIWNWNFVIHNFNSQLSYLHIGILLAPSLFSLAMLNPGFWLIMRSNTLTIGGSIHIKEKKRIEKYLDSPSLQKGIVLLKSRVPQIVIMIFLVTINLVFISKTIFGY
jgi:hypothetical protein